MSGETVAQNRRARVGREQEAYDQLRLSDNSFRWSESSWSPELETLGRWINDIELGKPAPKSLVARPYDHYIEMNCRAQEAPLLLCYWLMYQRLGFSPNESAALAIQHRQWNELAFPDIRWREIMSVLRQTECEGCPHLRERRIILDSSDSDESYMGDQLFVLEETIMSPR